MKRAEAAGCPVLGWTIDFLGGDESGNSPALHTAGYPELPVLSQGDSHSRRHKSAGQSEQADVLRAFRQN